MSVFPSSRCSLACLFGALVAGCGYVGVDTIGQSASLEEGDDTGGSAAGGGSSLGGAEGIGTGGGVGDATGGYGGALVGTTPGYPCSLDCDDPFLLYRTFEVGVPPGASVDWGGSIARDTTIVRDEEHSLRLQQGGSQTEAEIREDVRRTESGELFFRSWIYIPEGQITDWIGLVSFNNDADRGVRINAHVGQQLGVLSEPSMLSNLSEKGAFPLGQWFCLQVDLWVADEGGWASVRVDGNETAKITQVDTRPSWGVEDVVYGVTASGFGQQDATVYFDEIALSREPVDCLAGIDSPN